LSHETQVGEKYIYEKANGYNIIYSGINYLKLELNSNYKELNKNLPYEKEGSTLLEISGDKLAYLARMIRNNCLDFLKKRKIETSELNEAYQGSFEVEDALITKDLQEKIDKTIDSLPEKCRQVFVLSRFEELSYNEISKQLNISKKTVEAHISRALKSLRISLKQFLFILFKAN